MEKKTKCPKCGQKMMKEGKDGVTICSNDYCTYVMCSCGARMIPEWDVRGPGWSYWHCPHCFKRW